MLNKENIGKILFSIGMVMLFIMIFNPLNSFFIHIDEWYTISLIKMSFIDGIKLTAGDVHPPLYYLLVKSVVKILTWLNIPFNLIYVSKIVTLMPYLILLIVSATKVKREYSWLTAGILVFALGTMSEFFIKFITLRMYGWAFIFLLLAFIYFKDVINKSNWKYWMLMTIFSILGAYTHYFIAISVVIMYLLLLIYILFSRDYESNNDFNRKNEVKKWIISVFIGFVSYLPWVPIIITQLNTSNNYWIPSITNENIIQFLSYFATNSSEDFLKYFAIIFLIVLLTITILKLRNDEIKEKFYLFTGIIMVAGTFLFLLIFSLVSHPILLSRYLIPIIGILWLIFAIKIDDIKDKRLFAIILSLVILFGVFGIVDTYDACLNLKDMQDHDIEFLNSVNNNDTVIIHTNAVNMIMFNHYFNNTHKQYVLSNKFGDYLHHSLDFKEEKYGKSNKLINKHSDKNIYIIKNKGAKIPKLGENNTATKIDELCCSREIFRIN